MKTKLGSGLATLGTAGERVYFDALERFRLAPDTTRWRGNRWRVTYVRAEWAGGPMEGWFDAAFGKVGELFEFHAIRRPTGFAFEAVKRSHAS